MRRAPGEQRFHDLVEQTLRHRHAVLSRTASRIGYDPRASPGRVGKRGHGRGTAWNQTAPEPAAPGPVHSQIDGRGERIRTFDLLNPIQVRYQTALRPDRQSLAAGNPGSDLRTRVTSGEMREGGRQSEPASTPAARRCELTSQRSEAGTLKLQNLEAALTTAGESRRCIPGVPTWLIRLPSTRFLCPETMTRGLG